MKNDVFKGITIVGTSEKSFSDAIEIAINRAQETLSDLKWFEVKEQRGAIRDDKIEFQVTLAVYFRLRGEEYKQKKKNKKEKKESE